MTPAPLVDPSLFEYMTPQELAEIDYLIATDPVVWRPLPGPQFEAYHSEANVIGYGGAAGGGKTDLAIGKALTQHRKIMMLRRVGTELTGLMDRLEELLGSRDGYNGRENIWRLPGGVQIELGAVPIPGDEKKFQGRPHDLIVFEEATNFLLQQVRFLLTWLRSTVPGQRKTALLTFNPPQDAQGRWVIEFFAPWLDDKHPNPAKPGELRWAASLPADAHYPNGRDLWVADERPFVLIDGAPCYEFEPLAYKAVDIITPMSRTFIPSNIEDNPFLLNSGYLAQLQALPEPLRSQMLKGDFKAGIEDNPYQVIPTAWVKAAQERWKRPDKLAPMESLGVDVARGGRDQSIIARRHEGMWFDVPLVYPGSQTPDGPAVAGLTIAAQRDHAVIHIDVIGVGSSPYDFLNESGQQVVGVNVSEAALGSDKSGRLRFRNLRSELWWRMREALDPVNNAGMALPPDPRLLADLCAPAWSLSGSLIQVESREDIVAKIGRSPDFGSAHVLALIDTPKRATLEALGQARRRGEYDPLAQLDKMRN